MRRSNHRPNTGLKVIGYILMAAGIIGLIASIATSRPIRVHRVSESRVAADPLTGEGVVRYEIRDSGLW
ncbi:hypothetical protein [Pseudarthrobacter sulfonivorans]|uniref:hypothetical protein n=1 Tax=Pseudarthrobacter sulfonivorans TaxID=121292 RepID=UPI0027823AC7|nr:hypothetical protein [Pseudarthrobacter sulfonivorans]MDP9998403.1 hypothetical protein [Pseudarthrobacter sulfonivorans]